MQSKYTALRQKIIEIVNDLPTEYHTTFEVGYLEDPEHGSLHYGVYEEGTNCSICQTGISEALAKLITELLNNIDLVDSSLSLIGKLDEKYDLEIETEGESLPSYDEPKQDLQMTQKLDEIVVTETKITEANKKNVVDVSEVDPPVVCERPAYLPKEEPKKEAAQTVVIADKVVINE